MLAGSDFDPSNLILEITESAMMHDTETVVQNLHALRALGLRIAVDDFGTGFLVAGLPRAVPGRHTEDRPLVRHGAVR